GLALQVLLLLALLRLLRLAVGLVLQPAVDVLLALGQVAGLPDRVGRLRVGVGAARRLAHILGELPPLLGGLLAALLGPLQRPGLQPVRRLLGRLGRLPGLARRRRPAALLLADVL